MWPLLSYHIVNFGYIRGGETIGIVGDPELPISDRDKINNY